MISPQRQNLILESLRQHGATSIGELARKLRVSAMTVRRDLDTLEQRGLLKRTHGGAMLAEIQEADPPFIHRDRIHQPAKQLIARRAAELINQGEKLILDSGSTVAAICPHLEDKGALTVITYSLPVIQGLINNPRVNLICTGGTTEQATNSLGGSLAERVLEGVRVDKAFLGATSVSLEDGFSNSSLQNLTLQRILLKVARESYLLVDSTKFSRPSFWLVAGLEIFKAIITDEAVSLETISRLERAGIKVYVAENKNA